MKRIFQILIIDIILFFIFTSIIANYSLANPLRAPSAELREKIEALGFGVVEKIRESDYPGMIEITTSNKIIYSDSDRNYIFSGTIKKSEKNHGETRRTFKNKSKVKFSDLPLHDAVKIEYGNGERKMAVFEQIDCTYCKKIHQDIQLLDDITIYVFLISSGHPQASYEAKEVWCAEEQKRAKIFLKKMLGKKLTQEFKYKLDCENPLDRNLRLALKLDILGTPMVIFEDSTLVFGYIEADVIAQYIQ